MSHVPAPFYTLITTSLGGKPAIVVVNSALREFSLRPEFSWHLRVTVKCRDLGENQMPTTEEVVSLRVVEDAIASGIAPGDNAVFLARVTALGEQALIFRVIDPEVAHASLQKLTSSHDQEREWEYWMENDPDWELARPELDLVVRAAT